MAEAQKEEDLLRKAIEKVRSESEVASVEKRAELESQIAELSDKLAAAEAKNQRAISMASKLEKETCILSPILVRLETVFTRLG